MRKLLRPTLLPITVDLGIESIVSRRVLSPFRPLMRGECRRDYDRNSTTKSVTLGAGDPEPRVMEDRGA